MINGEEIVEGSKSIAKGGGERELETSTTAIHSEGNGYDEIGGGNEFAPGCSLLADKRMSELKGGGSGMDRQKTHYHTYRCNVSHRRSLTKSQAGEMPSPQVSPPSPSFKLFSVYLLS
jgi:hypothetical protein